MPDYVGMGKIFHNLDLLIDVLLEVGFLLDVNFADYLDSEQLFIIFFLRV